MRIAAGETRSVSTARAGGGGVVSRRCLRRRGAGGLPPRLARLLEQYAWGHDALRPVSGGYRDWYDVSLVMTPLDAFDTMLLMGLDEEAARAKESDIRRAVVRPRHDDPGLRGDHPAAGRLALGLPDGRRPPVPGTGRRSGRSPAAGVRHADGHALRAREPRHRCDRTESEQSGRDRHADSRVRPAQPVDRRSPLLRRGGEGGDGASSATFGPGPRRNRDRRRDRRVAGPPRVTSAG